MSVGIKAKILAASLLILVGASGPFATAAQATTYSVGVAQGTTQYGTYGEWHNNNMTMDHTLELSGNHINHTVWAASGSPCGLWVEGGVTQGYHGIIAYLWYFAYNNSNGYADYIDAYTSPDGTNHSYYMQYSGAGAYKIYRDGVNKAYVANLGGGTCEGDVGLENTLVAGTTTHSDTFDMTPMKYQDTGYGWHTGWAGTSSYIDSGYNGIWYGSSHWADNTLN